MVEPPGQLGLVARLAAIERRIAETQRAIPARPGIYGGAWWAPTTAANQTVPANANTLTTCINTVVQSPAGCTYTGGLFTATYGGWWLLSLSVQWVRDAGLRWVVLAPPVDDFPRFGGLGRSNADYMTVTAPVPLVDGQQVRTIVSTDVASSLYTPQGSNIFSAVWLGPL